MNNLVFQYYIALIDHMPNGASYEELFKPTTEHTHNFVAKFRVSY